MNQFPRNNDHGKVTKLITNQVTCRAEAKQLTKQQPSNHLTNQPSNHLNNQMNHLNIHSCYFFDEPSLHLRTNT